MTLYVTAPALAPHLVGADAAPTMSVMLRALALALPVAALYDLVLAATRGTGSMRPTVLVENIGRLGLQAVAVLVVYLAGGGALALALAWSLPYVVGLVLAGVWLRRRFAARTTPGGPPTPWRTLAREFWAYTAPRAIARVTQTALKRSDIVLVAALASPADAALYTAATRFVVLGQLFVQSVQQALSPHLSSLFARRETKAANSVFQAATLWSMLAAWPLYLVTAGFATPLMGVFGEGYEVASDVVVILSLTMLVATACGPVDSVLLMAGRSWLSLRNSIVALVVNIALNVVLIPLYGIRGAAIAWAVAIVVRNLLPLVQVRRHLGMWPATSAAVRVALAAVVCFGVVDVVAAVGDFPAGRRCGSARRGHAGLRGRHLVVARDAGARRLPLRVATSSGGLLAPLPRGGLSDPGSGSSASLRERRPVAEARAAPVRPPKTHRRPRMRPAVRVRVARRDWWNLRGARVGEGLPEGGQAVAGELVGPRLRWRSTRSRTTRSAC